MKRFVFAAVVALAAAVCLPAQTVKFSVGEWAPFTGEKIDKNGMAVEIVQAAAAAGGLKATFDWGPWKRAEASVVEGTAFGTFPYTDIAERKGKFLFSDTLFSSSFAVLTFTGNPKSKAFAYTGLEAFKGLKVGVTAGTDAVKLPLEKAGALVEETPSLDLSIKKLELGRIDLIVDDRAVTFDALQKLFPGDARFVFLDKAFGDKTAFKVMASMKFPDAPALVKKFNEGLAKIQADGTYQKILARYGLGK